MISHDTSVNLNIYMCIAVAHILDLMKSSFEIKNITPLTTVNVFETNPSLDSSIGSTSAWYHGGCKFKSRQGRGFFLKI